MARNRNRDNVTVIDKAEGAGAVVFWSLAGSTSYETLAERWDANGLDAKQFLAPATPAAALRAAVKEISSLLPRGYFTRQLGPQAVVVVREERDGDDAKTSREDFDGAAKVGIETDNGRAKVWAKIAKGASKQARTDVQPFVDAFRAAYRAAEGELSVHNLGWWITRMLSDYCHVLPLKDRGAVYYVPPGKMELWAKVRDAVEGAAAHHFYQIPAMRSDDAIAAVLEAVLREVTDATEAIYAEIEDETLGKRAVKTRKAQLDGLLGKMESYAAVLGPKIDKLRESVEACAATVVEAEMKLDETDGE